MKITYSNKSYINQNADIPAANKVQDTDMNEIKTVVNTNDDLLTNALYFKPGDTYTIEAIEGGYYTGGTMTGSYKYLHWNIPVPKSMANISTITISNLVLTIRNIQGNYIYTEATLATIDGTLTLNKISNYLIDCINQRVNAASGTNNTPIAVAISCTLTFN